MIVTNVVFAEITLCRFLFSLSHIIIVQAAIKDRQKAGSADKEEERGVGDQGRTDVYVICCKKVGWCEVHQPEKNICKKSIINPLSFFIYTGIKTHHIHI